MSDGWQQAGLLGLCFLAGALMAAQAPIYTRMAAGLGGAIPATLTAFVIAAATLLAITLVTGSPLPRPAAMAALPGWVWLGALIGVFMVLVSIAAVPRLGVVAFAVAVVAGQLFASQLYDRLGLFGLEPRPVHASNLAGLALIIAGVVLALRR